MDDFAADEEKFYNIRETIRQVILPLVQAIYLEEPSDIPDFCAEYFQSILQKRESSDKLTDERGSNAISDEQFTSKDGDLPPQKSNEETKETTDISKCNLQGSASLPVLTTDKQAEGLTLRETSSWNEQSIHSQTDGKASAPYCNLVDAVRGIGDQPDSLLRKSGTELKEEGNAVLKNENSKEFSDKNGAENQHMIHIKNDSPGEEHMSCVMPSAPPYDDDDKRMKYINPISPSLQVHHQVSFDQREKQSDSKNVNEYPKILSESSENSSYIKNVTPEKAQGMKICQGELSPNSSFGFIPHLHDSKLEEEKKKVQYSEESVHKQKSTSEFEKLTKQFSESLTDLADELDSAESHLNEYLKVKEISDIIQGKDKMKESSTDATFVRVSDAENVISNEKEETIKTKSDSNEATFVETTGENYGAKDSTYECNVQVSKCEYMEYSEKYFQKLNAAEEINTCGANEELCLTDDNTLETNKDGQEGKRDNKYEITNLKHDKELEENNPVSSQSNTVKEEDSKSHLIVDENWRRRWYEVHPRLDSINYSFQQRIPVVHRTRRVSFNSHRNQIIHNIGEAGDVPIDRRFHGVQDEARERLNCSSESNLDANSFSSSLDTNTLNSHSSLSADGMTEEMATHSVSNRSGTNTNTGISSQSIPYSWRLMSSKQSASPDENKGRILKYPGLKLEKDISDNTECSELNSKVNSAASYELESLQEVTAVEETEGEANANSLRSQKLMPGSGSNETDVAKIDEKQKISNEKISKVDTIIEEEPHSSAVNDQDLDDTKNKLCGNAATENLTTSKSYAQVTEPDQAFGSEPEHFYDTYEQFADSPQKIYPEKHFNEETALGGDYYAKKESKEHLNCTPKSDEGVGIKATDSNLTPLEKTEGRNACQIPESSVKEEPGLNAACGDFAQFNIPENSDRTINPFPTDINSEDVSNSSLAAQNHTARSIQEINAEYFEGIMGRILEQQNESLNDDYDGLNFSSYSGSESSNLEEPSDTSETDDKI